jgi:hypothetical protein
LESLAYLDHADPDHGESDFDGYDPADAEFDRRARIEAPAEYAEMDALEEMERQAKMAMERWAEGEDDPGCPF